MAWIVALMAWPHVPGMLLGGWICLMTGVLVARYFLTRAFRSAHHETDERWIALMVASVAITGVLWGTTGLFIADTPLHLDILIIVTVAMMTISAVSYLGQYLPAYFTFLGVFNGSDAGDRVAELRSLHPLRRVDVPGVPVRRGDHVVPFQPRDHRAPQAAERDLEAEPQAGREEPRTRGRTRAAQDRRGGA
ncbi:MAG: hypothetical protein M5U09_15685 [Gammaproteobacteria bacterium]|nr:hypothetical protein [Gammaproteobacteria bacterium]